MNADLPPLLAPHLAPLLVPVLPLDHPFRTGLNDEVHARLPDPLEAPARISYLALLGDAAQMDAALHAVDALAVRFDAPRPPAGASHYSADFGPFRLKWERHSEFVRYSFVVPGEGSETALSAVPPDWVAALPGELIVAVHVILARPAPTQAPPGGGPDTAPDAALALFAPDHAVGSAVADGAARAYADFRIRASGFGRMLVQDVSMTPAQAGRMVQALLEIDTYRMMALLALPVARALAPVIGRREKELAEINAAMVTAGEADEPLLLDRLTRLAAEIDSGLADNLYRFNAAAAYHALVQRRIDDLHETRLPGVQTWREFTERRLAPAMTTCDTMARRQEELSRRVARATQLLATRVGVTRERQSQELLATMNRRVRLQLRLQSTVEGLSIAAVTYYIVGLVGYAAKGVEAAGIHLDPALVMAAAVPVVAGIMALAMRRMHRRLAASDPH